MKRETLDELCKFLGYDTLNFPIYRSIIVTAFVELTDNAKRDIVESFLRQLPENK